MSLAGAFRYGNCITVYNTHEVFGVQTIINRHVSTRTSALTAACAAVGNKRSVGLSIDDTALPQPYSCLLTAMHQHSSSSSSSSCEYMATPTALMTQLAACVQTFVSNDVSPRLEGCHVVYYR